jgi:mannan endo-1,4-beta-mannosidase
MSATRLILAAALLLTVLPSFRAQGQTDHTDDFVQRAGTKLTLHGAPFRYSGPNIEWLGLEGYGPHDPMGPRYPSHFEIDDAFATAAEMGARVARAQTMGDTLGCPLCVEPELGKFNEAAFQASDYALAAAKRNGIRIIIPLVGDCATCTLGGIGQYLTWTGKQNPQDFLPIPGWLPRTKSTSTQC